MVIPSAPKRRCPANTGTGAELFGSLWAGRGQLDKKLDSVSAERPFVPPSKMVEASRRPEKPGRAECGRGRVPTGGVDRALSGGTFRRPKRDRRSLQGCRTRTAGQSGGRPAARGSPGRPRGPGRRASAGGPSEASQSRRLWRRQRGRALPTLSADDSSVNSTSVETHLQLKTTPRSARRTRGGGASESRLAETRTGSCVFKLHLEAGGTESGHGRSVDVAGTRRARVGDPREPASWLSLPSRERPKVPGSVCGCFRPRGAGPLSERTYWILTCFPFCDFSDPEICFLFQRLSQNS